MITDAFPLPFTDGILTVVAGHEMYRFLDGFRGYNQIRMHLNDPEKMTSVMEWGVFLVIVMTLRLKTVPSTFQCIIIELFGEYIPAFMHVFLDDFTMYDACDEHLHQLHFFLERCHSARLSLNPAKCAFGVTSGKILGHICWPVKGLRTSGEGESNTYILEVLLGLLFGGTDPVQLYRFGSGPIHSRLPRNTPFCNDDGYL